MLPSLLLSWLLHILIPVATAVFHKPKCTRPEQTAISYRGDGSLLPEIYTDLTSCPNITSLDLDLTWTGCTPPSAPWVFEFRKGDRFPPLRNLTLSDYDFRDHERWRGDNFKWKWSMQYAAQDFLGKMIPGLAPHDLPQREPNLEKWLQAMDFTQLEDLQLAQDETLFYERMKHELPGLKRLSLDFGNTGSSMPQDRIEFMREVPPLESLSVRIGVPYEYAEGEKNRTRFPLAEIVESHCPALSSLSLHQGESHDPRLRRPMLSVDDLSYIRDSCPSLTHLGLDLDRDAQSGWPNVTLEALMQFQNLTTLDIGLEIGADLHGTGGRGDYDWNPQRLDDPGPFREPRTSLNISETLFAELRRMKQGRPLERVVFVVGDYTEKPYSGPLYFPMWEEGRARRFVCQADHGADGKEALRDGWPLWCVRE